jgi:hypothetical protein
MPAVSHSTDTKPYPDRNWIQFGALAGCILSGDMDEQIAGLLKISDFTPVLQIVQALQFNPTALSFQHPKSLHLQVIRSGIIIHQNDEPDASSGSGALAAQIDKICRYFHQLQEGWPVHHAEIAQSQQR